MSGAWQGTVVSLDRGLPLVRCSAGDVRAQHSTEAIKSLDTRAVVGDVVFVEQPPGQDIPFIVRIAERRSTLVRRSLVQSIHDGPGSHKEQVLAANIDVVFVMEALGKRALDLSYLERQLVMAHESGVAVAVLLTKADKAGEAAAELAATEAARSAPGCEVIATSAPDGVGVRRIAAILGAAASGQGESAGGLAGAGFVRGSLGVLLGRSGVGKSTLLNALAGTELQQTGAVRSKDSAGRHTTVARRLVELPGGGALIDAPGLRSIGLYGAWRGLAAAFPEIASAAAACRFRDCTHTHEPGCAVLEGVAVGEIEARRLQSYLEIAMEVMD